MDDRLSNKNELVSFSTSSLSYVLNTNNISSLSSSFSNLTFFPTSSTCLNSSSFGCSSSQHFLNTNRALPPLSNSTFTLSLQKEEERKTMQAVDTFFNILNDFCRQVHEDSRYLVEVCRQSSSSLLSSSNAKLKNESNNFSNRTKNYVDLSVEDTSNKELTQNELCNENKSDERVNLSLFKIKIKCEEVKGLINKIMQLKQALQLDFSLKKLVMIVKKLHIYNENKIAQLSPVLQRMGCSFSQLDKAIGNASASSSLNLQNVSSNMSSCSFIPLNHSFTYLSESNNAYSLLNDKKRVHTPFSNKYLFSASNCCSQNSTFLINSPLPTQHCQSNKYIYNEVMNERCVRGGNCESLEEADKNNNSKINSCFNSLHSIKRNVNDNIVKESSNSNQFNSKENSCNKNTYAEIFDENININSFINEIKRKTANTNSYNEKSNSNHTSSNYYIDKTVSYNHAINEAVNAAESNISINLTDKNAQDDIILEDIGFSEETKAILKLSRLADNNFFSSGIFHKDDTNLNSYNSEMNSMTNT